VGLLLNVSQCLGDAVMGTQQRVMEVTSDIKDAKQGEFKNAIKNKLFGGSPCQALLAKKVERKKSFSLSFFSSIFFIAFLAVSLHEELKNTIQIISKNRT
jgi:hypothetical protein